MPPKVYLADPPSKGGQESQKPTASGSPPPVGRQSAKPPYRPTSPRKEPPATPISPTGRPGSSPNRYGQPGNSYQRPGAAPASQPPPLQNSQPPNQYQPAPVGQPSQGSYSQPPPGQYPQPPRSQYQPPPQGPYSQSQGYSQPPPGQGYSQPPPGQYPAPPQSQYRPPPAPYSQPPPGQGSYSQPPPVQYSQQGPSGSYSRPSGSPDTRYSTRYPPGTSPGRGTSPARGRPKAPPVSPSQSPTRQATPTVGVSKAPPESPRREDQAAPPPVSSSYRNDQYSTQRPYGTPVSPSTARGRNKAPPESPRSGQSPYKQSQQQYQPVDPYQSRPSPAVERYQSQRPASASYRPVTEYPSRSGPAPEQSSPPRSHVATNPPSRELVAGTRISARRDIIVQGSVMVKEGSRGRVLGPASTDPTRVAVRFDSEPDLAVFNVHPESVVIADTVADRPVVATRSQRPSDAAALSPSRPTRTHYDDTASLSGGASGGVGIVFKTPAVPYVNQEPVATSAYRTLHSPTPEATPAGPRLAATRAIVSSPRPVSPYSRSGNSLSAPPPPPQVPMPPPPPSHPASAAAPDAIMAADVIGRMREQQPQKYRVFRALSKDYLGGGLNASDYHAGLRALLGDDAVEGLVPQLSGLSPRHQQI